MPHSFCFHFSVAYFYMSSPSFPSHPLYIQKRENVALRSQHNIAWVRIVVTVIPCYQTPAFAPLSQPQVPPLPLRSSRNGCPSHVNYPLITRSTRYVVFFRLGREREREKEQRNKRNERGWKGEQGCWSRNRGKKEKEIKGEWRDFGNDERTGSLVTRENVYEERSFYNPMAFLSYSLHERDWIRTVLAHPQA